MPKKPPASSRRDPQTEKREPSTRLVRTTLEEARARLAAMNLPPPREVPDEEIDYSDIPEFTDEQLAQFKRLGPGRPPFGDAPRKMISIKLDQHLLADLKKEAQKLGKPYQSLIHEILTRHFKKRKSA